MQDTDLQSSSPAVVVVVVHGSRNPGWVAAQRAWFEGVKARVGAAVDLRLTFLELTAPLLEIELAVLEGKPTRVSILPFFLSKSGHVAEEIPGIAAAALPTTPWQILEPAGLDAVLGRNAQRRLAASGADPGSPVIVSGYGASGHGENWLQLVERIRSFSGEFAAAEWHFAPAGHFLADSAAPLRDCLGGLRARGVRRAAVLPLYLAVSSYQQEMIPAVLAEFPELSVAFAPDAVLPDPELEEWASDRIAQHLKTEFQPD